jgi:mycothiol synthase
MQRNGHGWELHTDLRSVPVAAVRRLVAADVDRLGARPLPDHVWLDLVEGARPGALAALALDGDDLVAYAQLSPGNASSTLAMTGERSAGSRWATGVLLEQIVGHVARHGGGRIHWVVVHDDADHVAAGAAHGFERGRTLAQMRVPLPLVDDGRPALDVDAFRVGVDEHAWLAVNNAAFADHPEQGGWDEATLRQREAEPWFDPAGFLLHHAGGRLAAFCWTKVHRDVTPELGEIYAIAVHPDFNGSGLGTRIVRAGLAHLAARGITTGMLFVDRANPAAVAMYERLGFRTHREDHVYVADVAAAIGAPGS